MNDRQRTPDGSFDDRSPTHPCQPILPIFSKYWGGTSFIRGNAVDHASLVPRHSSRLATPSGLYAARSAVSTGKAFGAQARNLCTEEYELHSTAILALEETKLGSQ